MIKSFFCPRPLDVRASTGVLLLRLIVGLAFIFHGWGKIQKPFSWMGDHGSIPGFFQALAAVSEFGGGIALILGLLTPLAMFGLACTMAYAAYFHISRGDPFVGHGASFEPSSVYCIFAVFMILVGPGRFSADAIIFKKTETP